MSIGDLDGDGSLDLAVSNSYDNTVSVLRNTSASVSISFEPKMDFNTGEYPYTVCINDLNGDGKSELIVSNSNSHTVSVFRNTLASGTISFSPKKDFGTGFGPFSACISDIDGDTKPDIVMLIMPVMMCRY